MTDHTTTITEPAGAAPAEDAPNPDLDDVNQRPPELPSVPVVHQGAVTAYVLPSRTATAAVLTLITTRTQNALRADPRRARAHLVCDVDWLYAAKSSGECCFWPARVPLELTHCDEVYAKLPADGTVGKLTIITEVFGQ